LHVDAEAWAEHAQQLAARLQVPIWVERVSINHKAGQGVEAAAREARYAAFAQVMAAGEVLLTAHHLDDQAETFMLQLMRGAGVRGLSAMPMLQALALTEGGAWHLRPLLTMPRRRLHALAMQMDLVWVDDPSNADTRYARNFVRHEVVPRLQQHWPQATQTLARCAERMASTEGLLLDLARLDLENLRGDEPHRLSVDGLRRLSVARMENALRAWLLELGLAAPPASRLPELQRVFDAREDAVPELAWPGVILRRWHGGLYAQSDVPEPALAWPGCAWSLHHPLEVPELGVRLLASQVCGGGFKLDLVQQGVRVCVRDAISLPQAAARASLTKRLQELGVPPWFRARLPLIYSGGNLLQISELWRSPAFCVQAHEEGVMIQVERLPGFVT
jgi:tRNA(Ile)-lysidine synthase